MQLTMKDVMTANCQISNEAMLTSNHCAALARELNAILSIPVVERQPAVWAMQSGLDRTAKNPKASHAVYGHSGEDGWDVPLYTAPPETTELQATIARQASDIERLRAELGECKGEYDRAVNKVDALREQLEKAQADLVRMTEGRDGLRSTLDEANKVIAWQRDEKPDLAELSSLRAALKFYADRDHYSTDDGLNWDSVSGEPMNILWHEEQPWFIEDGSVARAALSASAEQIPPTEQAFTFDLEHFATKERRTVTLTKSEVADGMEDTLYGYSDNRV